VTNKGVFTTAFDFFDSLVLPLHDHLEARVCSGSMVQISEGADDAQHMIFPMIFRPD
jgi:hypothetical protein